MKLALARPTSEPRATEASAARVRGRLWIPVALCTAGFAADFVTPLGVADAFTYVVAVTSCLWVRNPRVVVRVGAACTLLLAAGLLLAHHVEILDSPTADLNRLIGAVGLWIVTGLVWWNVRVDETLHQSRDLARQASQAKSRFLAVASHDLRQPLQTVGMLSGALARIARDPRMREIADQQQRALSSATGLLNTLLDLSKLESGALEPAIGVVDLPAVLMRLHEELADEAKRSGVRLTFEPTNVRVRSDPQWLRQILQNLLTNALRYTPSGGEVVLRVRQRPHVAEIDVQDSGSGIPQDKLEHIFDEFYRIEQPGGDPKGWGLGLSIVRFAAAMLGHEVSVSSKVGRGTTFTVTVPAVTGASATEPDLPAAGLPVRDGHGRHILIVDDDEAVAAATSLLLQTEGFAVDVAGSSIEVARHLSTPGFAPDLIISDLHLGEDKTGVDIVRIVRQRLDRIVPAIFISGETQTDFVKAANLECVKLLSKPVDTDELLDVIASFATPGVALAASGAAHREVLR